MVKLQTFFVGKLRGSMIIYIYPKCSTCKDALSFLTEEKVKVEWRDIKEQPPSRDELERMLAFQDGNLRKLFNTSGLVYKELSLSQKLPNLSKEEAFDLLMGNGMLVKRPFLLGKDFGLVGFKKEIWKKALHE